MKRIILSLCLAAAVIPLRGAEVPQIGNVGGRNTVSLNGEWNYIVDVQEAGYYDYRMNPTPWGFFRDAHPATPKDLVEYDFDKSAKMTVPGDWNTQDPQLFFYEGTVWFKRNFTFHPQPGRRTLLYFGAVNYEARVWVNGKYAGYHVGGFTPFNLEVTDLLADGDNFVIVKVDNKRHAEDVPTQIFDWWNYGGITREVLLVDTASNYIENYSLQLDREDTGLLHFQAWLDAPVEGKSVRLRIPELKVDRTVRTDAEGKVTLDLKARPQLWSPGSPKLYDVSIDLDGETMTDRIGFRTIATHGKELLLNGNPIFCIESIKRN